MARYVVALIIFADGTFYSTNRDETTAQSHFETRSLLAQFLTNIFEGFLELRERGEARLDDAVRPLVDLVVHVAVAADRALYRLLDDVGDLVDDELGLEEGVTDSFSALNDSFVSSRLFCRFICHFCGRR